MFGLLLKFSEYYWTALQVYREVLLSATHDCKIVTLNAFAVTFHLVLEASEIESVGGIAYGNQVMSSLTHLPLDKMAAILLMMFSNAFSWKSFAFTWKPWHVKC